VRGYTSSPNFAWAGWRLRIDGGPVGGQYHGYLADDGNTPLEIQGLSGLGDSREGWSDVWGGTALREGDTVSDYVYRSPGEVQPRPNASGGVNTIRSLQTERRPGYAEAPGNYRYLGAVHPVPGGSTGHPRRPVVLPHPTGASAGRPFRPGSKLGLMMVSDDVGTVNVVRRTPTPGASTGVPVRMLPGESVVRYAYDPRVFYSPGPTNYVAQPPPPQAPGGTLVAQTIPPVSPAPAPTVAATPADYLPSQGQVVPGITPAASTSSVMNWLTASSIWSAVPNGVLLAGVALGFFALSGRGGRR
jgi:hypothetical protein